jgi:hypothetical protein
MLISSRDRSRVWNKVLIETSEGCWIWMGTTNKDGYGQIYINYKLHLAHRIVYLLHTKRFPTDNVLHTCDNPPCCNPKHLFEGTQNDNVQDMKVKKRAARLNGVNNPNSKLTNIQLEEIERYFSIGVLRSEIAKLFKISWTHADTLQKRYLTKKVT